MFTMIVAYCIYLTHALMHFPHFEGGFDKESELRNFVACKIESLVAQKSFDTNQDPDSMQYKVSSLKFSKLFNMPKEEKLVNCKLPFVSF